MTTELRLQTLTKEYQILFDEIFGVNDDDLKELEELFESDEQLDPPQVQGNTVPNSTDDKVGQTKAFAKRLKESTTKARLEERESIAKSLGYDSFEELQKSRERKTFEDAGLDPDDVSPIVEELVKQRIDADPRMQELEAYRAKRAEEFGKKELAEITKLTNGKVTKFDDIPADVMELWKKKGSLKAAYLELKGEELILQARSEQSKGSTAHLNTPTGSSSGTNGKRHLTEQEKKMWRFFTPSITEEELNKKLVDN